MIVEPVFWLVVQRVVLWSGWAAGWRCSDRRSQAFWPYCVYLVNHSVLFEHFYLWQSSINVFASTVPKFLFCIACMSVCVFAEWKEKTSGVSLTTLNRWLELWSLALRPSCLVEKAVRSRMVSCSQDTAESHCFLYAKTPITPIMLKSDPDDWSEM